METNQTRRQALRALTATGFTAMLASGSSASARRREDAVDPVALARAALTSGGLVEGLLEELVKTGRFSGTVMAVVEGEPLLARAWGQSDKATGIANTMQTRFAIASAGKMFTTVGIGQLLEQGKLGLDDKLVDHLPDFRPDIGRRITIGQLLSHTSGMGSYFASPLWEARHGSLRSVADYLTLIENEQLLFEPGERYEYSNSGFTLLGAVIERLTSQDYYAAMQAKVFAPAGMTGTGYPLADDNAADIAIPYTNGCFMRPPGQCAPGPWQDARSLAPYRGGPAGGGVSTAPDLVRFATALKEGRLLKPETLNLLKAERGKMTRQGGPLDAYAMGFGRLTVHGQSTWGHNGGTVGAQAQLDVFEDAPIVLVVLSNQDGGQRAASSALRRSVAPPGWTPPAPPPGAGPVMVRPG